MQKILNYAAVKNQLRHFSTTPKLNGIHELPLPNGYYYKGNFKDNQYHGKGAIFNELNKKTFEGFFSNHRIEGKGSQYTPDGELAYQGDFHNDEKQG